MKAFKWSIALSFVALFSIACGTDQPAGNANQSQSANAPPDSPAATLFKSQSLGCMACHGPDGRGTPQMKDIPNFADPAWQAKVQDPELVDTIKNGKPNHVPPMPAYSKRLTDDQIKDLVVYIRSLVKQ